MISAYINGVGLLGPGIQDWQQGQQVLANEISPDLETRPKAHAELLPPNERRRAGASIRLAMHVAGEAARNAGCDPATLPTLFSSCHGDMSIAHRNCESLASNEPWISPTLFHNSVHNASAGYWHIATGSTHPSSSISSAEHSFPAGLLAAICAVNAEMPQILYVCADCKLPETFAPFEHITEDFGVALVLSTQATSSSMVRIDVSPVADTPSNSCNTPELEFVRQSNPAARCLPMLELIARKLGGECILPSTPPGALRTRIEPC